jgi:hypothetical protein
MLASTTGTSTYPSPRTRTACLEGWHHPPKSSQIGIRPSLKAIITPLYLPPLRPGIPIRLSWDSRYIPIVHLQSLGAQTTRYACCLALLACLAKDHGTYAIQNLAFTHTLPNTPYTSNSCQDNVAGQICLGLAETLRALSRAIPHILRAAIPLAALNRPAKNRSSVRQPRRALHH